MRFLWLPLGLASWGLALWFCSRQGNLLPQDVALHYLRGLDAAQAIRAGEWGKALAVAMQPLPNPGTLGGWIGLWMALFGSSPMVALASLLPLHLGMAWGLWRGGEKLGGPWAGPVAAIIGLTLPVGVQQAASIHPDFLLMAGSAMMVGALLNERPAVGGMALAMATAGKLAALPSLGGMALDGIWRMRGRRAWWILPVALVFLLIYLPNLRELGGYAAGSDAIAPIFRGPGAIPTRILAHIKNMLLVGSPSMLIGVVAALLLRRDGAAFRPLLWAMAGMIGISLLEHQPQQRYMLPMALPIVVGAMAGGVSRYGKPLLALLLGVHLLFLTQSGLWTPMLQKPPQFDVDGVLDWLVGTARHLSLQHPRVALQVEPGGPLSGPAFLIRARQRNLDLQFQVVEEQAPLKTETDLGVILDLPTREERAGWQAFLPPPTETHAWPGDYQLKLWDRGLPLEPTGVDRSQHPANQALYVQLADGTVKGPLLQPASSVEVIQASRWHVLFVRDQQLWAAEGDDGLVWEEPKALGIAGFDPALVQLPAGGWRLFVSELVGQGDDPAKFPTRIVSFLTADLRHFQPEAGVRLEGTGLVDPSVVLSDPRWELYYTEGGTHIRRAFSTDGLQFEVDPNVTVSDATVPLALPNWLITQRFVGDQPVFYRQSRSGDRLGAPVSLEVCGTGASKVGDRLYFSRDPALPPCAPPTIFPSRRPGSW